jgi:hypothetical protein
MKINVYVNHHIIDRIIHVVNNIFSIFSLINFIIYIVRVVGAACNNNEECGSNMECKGKRCACNAPQRIEESQDNNGRPIQICVNGKI